MPFMGMNCATSIICVSGGADCWLRFLQSIAQWKAAQINITQLATAIGIIFGFADEERLNIHVPLSNNAFGPK